jgi:hypothetical protein
VVVSLLAFWLYRSLHTTRLSRFVRSDLPILDLQLQFISIRGEKIPAAQTRLADPRVKAPQSPPASSSADCPELIGGDNRNRTQPSTSDKRGESCPQTATWFVKRHPIGFSLYVQEPQEILAWTENDQQINELLKTRFFRGVFTDPLHSSRIRAEDLKLSGLEGAFLRTSLREAFAAHAEVHYDIAHGKRGLVFSFVRDECPMVSKALPIIAHALPRSGYRVAQLREPVLEMRIGLQRVFLTEVKDRIYVANGLEALLNVLESLRPPASKPPRASLVLAVRAEALVDKLLPVMVGQPTWDLLFAWGLSENAPGLAQFAGGRFARHLRPRVFKGVLASIPHDVFAAVVTSHHLPPDMTIEEWQQLATRGPVNRRADGPEEAGVALLWDLSSEGGKLSNMGLVIANQQTPDEVDQFKRYFADAALTAECGGGTVFLAATSSSLLTRMQESCAGQSLSVLDWERGNKRKDYENTQLFLFMNPATGLRELFLAGGAKSGDAGEFEPEWKQQYEQAKEAMRSDSEKLFGSLPLAAFAGNPVRTEEMVRLPGFTVKQGASR